MKLHAPDADRRARARNRVSAPDYIFGPGRMLVGYWISLRQACARRDNSFGKCCFPFSLRFDRAFALLFAEGIPPPRERSVAAGANDRHRSPAAVFNAITGTPVTPRFSCIANGRHRA